MWKNYFDVALRGFLTNKLFSFINVFGLAVGLASAILIGLYVTYELSYDDFHPDADRLYRIGRDIYPRENFTGLYMATVPVIAARQLQEDYPQIELIARARRASAMLGRQDQAYYEDALLYADPEFLDLFAFQWLAGDPDTALDSLDSIVLTESLARKHFGDENPLGQRLTRDNQFDHTVTGVIRDIPDNTHLHADLFLPLDNFLNRLPEQVRNGWDGGNMMLTYARLTPDTDVDAMSATFPEFMDRRIGEYQGIGMASQFTGLNAMKVTDIHLHSDRQNDMKAPGSMAVVISLATVALGIVLIACFNFMNLSTARSIMRGKEVGIRKTIGAERRHLIGQFLGESLGMALLATLIAIMLVEIILPAFNGFSGKTLDFDVLNDVSLQLALGLLVLLTGIIAGSYPALYLSAFKPAQVLKNRVTFGLRDVVFRNLLVVLQFSISIILVIATAVVVMQNRYVRNFDPGFDKEQVVILDGSPTQGLTPRWQTLKEELLLHPNIVSATASNILPGMENLQDLGARVTGIADCCILTTLIVDYDFFETYRIEQLAGRLFTEDFPTDSLTAPDGGEMSGNFIINASAARLFGWAPEQAVGQDLDVGAPDIFFIEGRVVGVVPDSNFETLRYNVKPLLFMLGRQEASPFGPAFNNASVRITANDIPETLAYIDSTWQRVIQELSVSRRFLSDDFETLYQDDKRLGEMFSYFAALAILVACLGLFGLATFNSQRRIKEIGIRKVMGGSVWSIVLLLTNDFSKLVLISNVIAWPVAWYAMNQWLANFAYRIDLTPLIFIGSGLIALCIAWVTVGGTAAKAASARPVLALRYE
jgi:putative ABC transport system permease protein